MAAEKKNVFYVKYLADEAIFKQIVGDEGSIALTRLENDSPASVAGPVLAAAHGYQVGASRDELARQFHVTRELLAQCPKLLVVSSNGAGYDTVDVEACTEAGVLVVNQAGGNAQSVAEHALGMMLSLSKRIVEVDKALRREGTFERTAYKGVEVFGKTVGIIGIGNVGTKLAGDVQKRTRHDGAGLRSLRRRQRDRRRAARRRSSWSNCSSKRTSCRSTVR